VSLSGELEIRRILLALDASPGSLAALEGAVDLAAKIEAELSGVFVEDEDLMRMAESPYARQILYPSAAGTPTSRVSVERELKSQAERARDTLARAAQRAHIRWSFRVVRGQVTPQLLAAAGEGDLLAVGRVSWHRAPSGGIGSTAFTLAASGVPLLLAAQRMRLGNVALAVYYDGSSAAQGALLTAARLARAGAGSVTVLLAAKEAERPALRRQADEQLRLAGVAMRHRRVTPGDQTSLLEALHGERAGLLVMPSHTPFHHREALEKLLRKIDTPVLWLGDGSEAEG